MCGTLLCDPGLAGEHEPPLRACRPPEPSAVCAAQELEEGIAALSADLKRARKDLEASRADNLALVERLKYVQGYQSAAGKARKGGVHAEKISFLAITSFVIIILEVCPGKSRCRNRLDSVSSQSYAAT